MHELGTTPDAAEMADRAAIQEVLALHCRGVDRADVATLKACYWPDATTAYGSDPMLAHEFCEQLVTALQGYAQTHHVVSNMLVDFGVGDAAAQVESVLIAFHYQHGDGQADREMTYFGRYLDHFEKRANVWKLMHREPVMSWSQHAHATHDGAHPALSQLRKSGRFPDDPIYQ
jgi:hypothetical protein